MRLHQSLGSTVTRCSVTDQHVCVFKVISPVRPDLPLAPNVPDVQFKALRLDTFDVKSLLR